jgi:hypothetical protein
MKKAALGWSDFIHSRVFGTYFPEMRETKEDFLCVKH